jgi:hypothetical protein
MSDTPYVISRVLPDGSETFIETAPSRDAANKRIAALEALDPKGSLIWYSRVPLEVVKPKTFRSVKSVAIALAAFE